MSKVYEKLRGRLRVELLGAFPESVLNAAALAAIPLWDMDCVSANTLRLSLYESDGEAFREIVKRCGCEYTLLSTQGGSRDRRTVRRRLPLIIIACVTAALLLLSSLFIWEIDIRGNRQFSRSELLRALSGCGVECGVYWPALSSDLVRSRMLELLPGLGWMTVNVNGSRATVLITERQEKPEIYSEAKPADVVAKKTGIIERLSVLNGKPAVQRGSAVAEGELIAGGRMDSIVGGARYVRAKASALAHTWYELCSAAPVAQEEKTRIRAAGSRFAIIFGKRRINLYINTGNTIDECDKIVHDNKLGIEGLFSLPVRIVREELLRCRRSADCGADYEAMERVLDKRLEDSVDGEILSRSFTRGTAEGLYVLTLRARCLEEIAVTVPMEE